MAKRYEFKRREVILGSNLQYIGEAGYNGTKHRHIIAHCMLCNSIKVHRLDAIVSGAKSSCGCRHKEMVESGIIQEASVKVRKTKPYLQRGGRGWGGYIIHIPKDGVGQYTEKVIEQILEFVNEA